MIGNPPLLGYLEEREVTLKDKVDSALERFVPHPDIPSREPATQIILRQFRGTLPDNERYRGSVEGGLFFESSLKR